MVFLGFYHPAPLLLHLGVMPLFPKKPPRPRQPEQLLRGVLTVCDVVGCRQKDVYIIYTAGNRSKVVCARCWEKHCSARSSFDLKKVFKDRRLKQSEKEEKMVVVESRSNILRKRDLRGWL